MDAADRAGRPRRGVLAVQRSRQWGGAGHRSVAGAGSGGLYVRPFELECPNDEQWSQINDFVDLSSGIAADAAEAVRRSVSGIDPDDIVSERRSGYPEADDDETTTVAVSRDGRVVAIFGLTLAHDGRWLINGSQGCASVGIS